MASTEELKRIIDCHDLAGRLGLERPHGKNYRSPHHEDKTPSLSIYSDGTRWKDHSSPGSGGSCIDLVMYVLDMELDEALRWLHEEYGLERERRPLNGTARPQTKVEWIAQQCRGDATPAVDYLEGRGIRRETIEACVKRGSIGYNDWTSPKVDPGQPGHHGSAVAFIALRPETRETAAVCKRFIDPDLNGGVKTQTNGDKGGACWSPDWRAVDKAVRQGGTVYITDGETDALSIHDCEIYYSGVIATLGNSNEIDWSFLVGAKVVVVPDADDPDKYNRCAGREWAWRVHEALTSLNVATHIVDTDRWYEEEIKDVNELLQEQGHEGVRIALKQLEPWIIAGMPGHEHPGRSRVRLPGHDWAQYWRYRHKEDFVTYIKKQGEQGDDGENKPPEYLDVCGFRCAALSRVTVQSAGATMSGRPDAQPQTLFSVTVQTPRHGPKLVRRVLEDERVHNIDQWSRFGPIYSKPQFHRMINILERAADIGARNAVNYVGVAWKEGRPVVNEGADCYFTDPDKQCPYNGLQFPRGARRDGERVLEAWRRLFRSDAAAQLLTWTLGAHLKAFLGFWPHMVLQADKGTGKSTLLHFLTEATACQVFGGQSLQTEFRLLTSLSHTSHPVGWEELSARSQRVIDAAVSMLQESYTHTVTRRGADLTEYLVSAPVMLAGEDVPVRSLTGKLTRVSLTGRKGELLPRGLPAFPVYEWLRWLTTKNSEEVQEAFEAAHAWCAKHSRATGADDGAVRMAKNYAAVLTAWKLLNEFLGTEADREFAHNLAAEMNSHISETTGDREPWVWILELLLGEIAQNNYRGPHEFEAYVMDGGTVECLVVRATDIMQHLSTSMGLRDWYDALPVKSARVLKRQLHQAGVIFSDRIDITINGRRHCHMIGLDLGKLAEYGLHAAVPEGLQPTYTTPEPAASHRPPISHRTH